ncbi:MAG TPA: sensor histidine kinase [Ktedonobacteraceae bacterium]|jgi:two-component system sensor histidine kinase UhpB
MSAGSWLKQMLIPIEHRWPWMWRLSIFEKVIVANSAIILLETAAGWWITQYNPETYHYAIDTTFIALAAFLGMMINFLVLRAAFAPLHSLLNTIQAIEAGDLEARAEEHERDANVLALARTFNRMLNHLAQARYDAAGHVLRAQEEERRRLALELHDQIGQSLTALTFHAEAIVQYLAHAPAAQFAPAQRQAGRLTELTKRTLKEVQELSRQLRPSLLDDLGLSAALRWLVDDIGERFNIPIHLQIRAAGQSGREHDSPHENPYLGRAPTSGPIAATAGRTPEANRLPEEVETALFRIAQESMTNAIRHSKAHLISLLLLQRETSVTLLVGDDGTGFLPEKNENKLGERRVGLEGMYERAVLLGGTLRVRSQPGRGCVVRAHLPLRSPEPE